MKTTNYSLIKEIDEQIEWYDQNSTRKDDEYIKAHLKLIKNLAENVENSDDILFVEKIVETFCDIIETQRSVICDLESEKNQERGSAITDNLVCTLDSFADDEQLQNAFFAYVLSQGKSSYTSNDYCTRIKKLWKSFYKEYQDGKLPDELEVIEEKIKPDSPLLNAFYHTDELSCYISMKLSASGGDRNYANARAALNKLDDFKISIAK